jgi:SNF2 family DNA or RNA helicase
MAESFPYKTTPFGPYQREIIRDSRNMPFAYYAMEQGTGKSYITIIVAAYLYLTGKISGMIIVAPNTIHTQWALEQIPTHMPEPVPWRAHVWDSGPTLADFRKAKKKRDTWRIESFIDAPGFPILCINSETLHRPLAKRAITLMLKRRKCLLAVDEAGDFTNGGAKRTRALMRWRHMAPFRRLLEGVPVGGSPFELYSPMRFLSPLILGYESKRQMEDAHAEWNEVERPGAQETDRFKTFRVIRKDKTGRPIYKDLESIARKIKPYTFRVLKKDVLPFLPKKLFHKRFFELTDEQWRLTNELLDDMTTTLANGRTVTATNVLTQYLRFQQIAAGYVPMDPDYSGTEDEAEPPAIIPGPNPRLDLLMAELQRFKARPTVIWTRFRYDIDLISEALDAEGIRFVTYDGRIDATQKAENKARFVSGDVDYFVANPAAAGRGLDGLQRSNRVYAYTNYFGLRRRLQWEDRTHRIGTGAEPVDYTDLLGRNSIDMLIVRALRNNQNVADIITGDPAKEWL